MQLPPHILCNFLYIFCISSTEYPAQLPPNILHNFQNVFATTSTIYSVQLPPHILCNFHHIFCATSTTYSLQLLTHIQHNFHHISSTLSSDPAFYKFVIITSDFFSFLPSQFTVRVGEWDLSDQDSYSVEVQVESIVAHPNFRPNGFYNDVAVFTLKQAVTFSQ